uniref:Uncharacterized protein n=1 Tax=Manihot esculenta TaxID=3983 RepID=A0A2C9UTJ7_MANES
MNRSEVQIKRTIQILLQIIVTNFQDRTEDKAKDKNKCKILSLSC